MTRARFLLSFIGVGLIGLGCSSSGDVGTAVLPDIDGGLSPDASMGIDIGEQPGCTPRTCEDVDPATCGAVPDGCGGILEDCGVTCEAPETCGGGGEPSRCGTSCTPTTCEAEGKDCGYIPDGCGDVIQCGECTEAGASCGSGGEENVCYVPEGDPDNCPALLTCEDLNASCGLVSNGCGGQLDCGAESGGCPDGELCGYGGTPNQCGAPTCTPLTCADVDVEGCGPVPDGCGGLLENCGVTCEAPETCGGGGHNRCGVSGSECVPLTAGEVCDGKCGPMSDGCGGTVDCGGCAGGQTCGGAGVPSECGTPPPPDHCIESCAQVNADCGVIPDGCGGFLDCSPAGGPICPEGQTCGGGGVPNQCGVWEPPPCDPAEPGEVCPGKCGPVPDGCSGVVQCGVSCPAGETCGGGGTPSECGAPEEDPCDSGWTSCLAAGWECGIAVDSCGRTHDCADEGLGCGGLETCIGGIAGPAVCEGPSTGDCPLCDQVPDCSEAAQPTRLTGRVITPGRDDGNTGNQVGVPNAFVYILRTNDPADLPAIDTGLPDDENVQSCDRCEEQDLGPVLASAVTNARGEFTLERNIPVGTDFLLVVKVGKFRRAVHHTLAPGAACGTTDLPHLLTRLPRDRGDGVAVNIPHVAIVTGDWDAMECVFEKMGIEHDEFTQPQLDGRIHLYRDNGAWPPDSCNACASCSGSGSTFRNCVRTRCEGCDGCSFNSGCRSCQESYIEDNCEAGTYGDAALSADQLHQDGGRIGEYDMVVSDCRGNGNNPPGSDGEANIRRYVNRGGRVFASHWSDNWIQDGTDPYSAAAPLETGLAPAATWGGGGSYTNGTGVISQNPPRTHTSQRIQSFVDWMVNEDAVASATNLTFNIPEPRSRSHALGPYTEEFVYCTGSNCVSGRPHQLAFFTPYAPPAEDAACGRVVYSGFHVSVIGTSDEVFPSHCVGDLSPTEKALLYMIFDLGACVGSDPRPPDCTPRTCDDVPEAECGVIADGCGGTDDCGDCPEGLFCGFGGGPNLCGEPECTLLSCAEQGATCGVVPDGCGGDQDCGPCPGGQVCIDNLCQAPPCEPVACSAGQCGHVSDGCSGTVDCGPCPDGQICGGGGPNVCGTGTCTPLTCEDVPEAECGLIADGCGGTDDCGPCPDGQTCGGAGIPNVCSGECIPLTCDDVDAECGPIGDGCGGIAQCPPCPEPLVCGGGGVPSVCGGECVPLTCSDQNAECGLVGNGCGAVVDCGPCPPGQVCGGDGVPNRCGDGPSCTPLSCEDRGAECGLTGDGCGDLLDCGDCPPGQTCGGDGVPNRCGEGDGGCVKLTCEDQNADCGPVADGCGGIVDCGPCPPGTTCGGDGVPNRCGGQVR